MSLCGVECTCIDSASFQMADRSYIHGSAAVTLLLFLAYSHAGKLRTCYLLWPWSYCSSNGEEATSAPPQMRQTSGPAGVAVVLCHGSELQCRDGTAVLQDPSEPAHACVLAGVTCAGSGLRFAVPLGEVDCTSEFSC